MKRLGGMSDLVTESTGGLIAVDGCGASMMPLRHCGRAEHSLVAAVTQVFLLLIFALLCMPFAAMAQAGTPNDITNIRSAGVLRVSITNFDLPGFRTRDGRTLSGPEVDLAHQIAAVLGVTVRFVDTAGSFDTVIDDIAEGRADIGISKLSQTYSRMLRVRFSNPYVTLRHSLLFSRASIAKRANGQPLEQALRDFNGRVGVIARSAYEEAAYRNFPKAEVVPMDSWAAVITALRDNRVDAVYRDEFETKRVLRLNPAMNIPFGTAIVTDRLAMLSVALCDTCARLQELVNYHLTQTTGAFSLTGLLENSR
jgi:ABC-type amino acid transport substrate-binding protein